jgi:hypothetical protein
MVPSGLQDQVCALFQTHGQAVMESALAEWYLKEALGSRHAQNVEERIAKALSLHREATYYHLAEYNQKNKNFSEAVHCYLKAYASNQDDTQRRKQIGEFLLRYGTQAQILDFYTHVRKIDADHHLARFVLSCYRYFDRVQQEIGEKVNGAIQKHGRQRLLLMQLCFWGERYTDIFLNLFLPALCAQGNLPAIFQDYQIHFIVFTDSNGAERFRAHPACSAIKPFVIPHLVVLPAPFMEYIAIYSKANSHGWSIPATLLTNAGHYATLELGRRLDSYVLNLCPDHVVPNRFMTEMATVLERQPNAIAGPGFRLYYNNDVRHELESAHRTADGIMDISERDMIRMLIRFLPEQNFVDSAQYSNFPIYLCWRVPGEGLIAHVNHYHPWVVKGGCLDGPVELGIDPIDGYFLDRKLIGKETIALAPPGMLSFDLGDNPLCQPISRNRFNPHQIAQWVSPYLTPVHARYFLNPNYYLGHEGDGSREFKQKAAEALQTVKEIVADASCAQ